MGTKTGIVLKLLLEAYKIGRLKPKWYQTTKLAHRSKNINYLKTFNKSAEFIKNNF